MGAENTDFACACGQYLRVPASGAGKQFTCPKCGKVVVCPAPAAETVGAVPQVPTAAATPDPAAQQAAAAQVIQQQVKMFAFWDRLTTDTPETYWLWIGLGGGLGCLVPLGILLCITLIGACLGIPMVAIGSGAGGFSGVLLFYRYVRKKSDTNVPPSSPPAQPTAPKT